MLKGSSFLAVHTAIPNESITINGEPTVQLFVTTPCYGPRLAPAVATENCRSNDVDAGFADGVFHVPLWRRRWHVYA